MHELSITRSVVAICDEQARGAKVTHVRLQIGALSGVVPEAVRFCFGLCAEGTAVEGATLEIIDVPGLARCRSCERDVPLAALVGQCICGSIDLQLLAGDELKIKDMEVL